VSHGLASYTCQTSTGTCIPNKVDMDGSMQSQPDSSLPMEASVGPSDASQVMDAAPDTAAPPDANFCTTSADCMPTSSQHPEVMCDLDLNQCIQLTTDDCPAVLPPGNPVGSSTPYYQGATDGQGNPGIQPIFIGAFATIPSVGGISAHPSGLNYQLALTEIATQGGVPAGSGNAYRYPVAVVCNDTAVPSSVVNHLINDVHTSAIIAALPSTGIKAAFAAANLTSNPNAPSIFFMNPFGADTSITPPALATSGLLWHMLGEPSDTAAAYSAFFPYIERYVRNTPTIGNGAPDAGSRPLRVATFTAQATDLLDLAAAVEPLLTWNGGQTIAQNSPANYLDVEISTSTLNGADLNTQIDVSYAVQQLTAFQPDIVISFASEEFIKLIQTLEAPPSTIHPFYLLSPYNVDSTDVLTSWVGINSGYAGDAKRDRMAGIAFASTANSDVLASYTVRFNQAFPTDQAFLNNENYYDAMYFTVYSLVGAGRSANLMGTNIAAGMTRLINPLGDPQSVGPTDIPNVIGDLQALNTKTVALTGTLGPPQFNLTTGARVSQGDVYCINRTGFDAGMAFTPFFDFDDLRLVPAGGTAMLSDGTPDNFPDGGPIMGLDGGAPPLEGTFNCYSGMFP
jgi:hypothetical protein